LASLPYSVIEPAAYNMAGTKSHTTVYPIPKNVTALLTSNSLIIIKYNLILSNHMPMAVKWTIFSFSNGDSE